MPEPDRDRDDRDTEDPRVEDDRERVERVDQAWPVARVGVEVVRDTCVEPGQRRPVAEDQQCQQGERDGNGQRRQATQGEAPGQRPCSVGQARPVPRAGAAAVVCSTRPSYPFLPVATPALVGNDHGSEIISAQPWRIRRGRRRCSARYRCARVPGRLDTLRACSIPDSSVTTPTPYARRSAPEGRTRASSMP